MSSLASELPYSSSIEPATSRWHSLDALRGTAVLLIAIANAPLYLGPRLLAFHPPPADVPAIEHLAHRVLVFVQAQHVYVVFALLFGYGLGVELRNAAYRHHVHICRRLALLATIGILHAGLLWYGDILWTYALGGIILLAMQRFTHRLRLRLALLLLVAAPLAFGLAEAHTQSRLPDPADRIDLVDQITAYRSSGLRNVTARRLEDALLQAPSNLLALPLILAMMIVGAEAAVGHTLVRLAVVVARLRMLFPLLVGAGLSLTLWATMSYPNPTLAPEALIAAPMTTLALAMWLLSREQAGLAMYGQIILADVGRVALSAYLSQSLIYTTIAYGYGGATFGTWARSQMLPLALAVAVSQAVVAYWWLRVYAYGPAEWVWRRIATGRRRQLKRHRPLPKTRTYP